MRLTYANVVSTLALFLVLTGGAAYAAHRYLTKKSVGTSQLRANAVTTSKIKANAITTRKIKKIAVSSEKLKENAVTREKLADAAVNKEKIDMADVPFGRVVARMRGSSSVQLEESTFKQLPLSPSVYTQEAEELDTYYGSVNVNFPASCEAPRRAIAVIFVDKSKPTEASSEEEASAAGVVSDEGTGAVTRQIQLSPFYANGVSFENAAPKTHSVALTVAGECKSGGPPTAGSAAVDVVGVR
jgi:methionine-rich copper-binding protein CopC